MNNDAEKGNKWKKFGALMTQVLLYVMHLSAILLAFLPIVIIIVLALDWVSTETQLIIKIPKIITSITVIITIYPILFLCVGDFRKSLSKIKKNICEVSWPTSLKGTFTESLKLAAYPMHFAIRLVVRFLLLVTMLLPVLLSLILIVISIALFVFFILVWIPEPLEFHDVFNNTIFKIITLFIAIVLIGFLIRELKNDIKNSISNIKAKIVKVVQGRWLPEMNIRKSLSVTWEYYVANFWLFLKKMCIESKKLLVTVLLLYIITFCGYIIDKKLTDETTPASKEWRDSVSNKLDYIKKNIAPPKPSTSYRFKKGTKFSLVYKEGDLKTKKGICLEDSTEDSNLEWLELFKQAISDGSKDRRLKLNVKGFASVAPVPVNGIINDKQSNSLNLQIANERAEALIYFLMLPDSRSYDQKECKAVLKNGLIWQDMKPDSTWEGTNFDLAYKPWESYNEMDNKKPLKNPLENLQKEEGRQLDREFLNRSVQIIIEEVSYRTKTTPESPREDNTGQSN